MSEQRPSSTGVHEMRLVVTVADFETALAFYRDALGMAEIASYDSAEARATLLDAGRATLELADARHAADVAEIEVGMRVAGLLRVAFQVADAAAATERAVAAGAELIKEPVATPWRSLNSRMTAPGGIQLTLFEELGPVDPDDLTHASS